MPVGDKLARGDHSAAFSGAGSAVTDFEQDFAFLTKAEIEEKYGLSEIEYDVYDKLRVDGQKLPDLTPLSLQETQELGAGFSIADHRRNYDLIGDSAKHESVVEQPKKFPEPTYGTARPILDRILVMRIADDPDTEVLEDGSTRSKRTGLVTAAKYRQHSNVGIVLAAGGFVVLGGLRIPMEELITPLDKVVYGDYNSEVFPMDRKKAEALCDALEINYVDDQQGLRLVRVQDVRTVEKPVKA